MDFSEYEVTLDFRANRERKREEKRLRLDKKWENVWKNKEIDSKKFDALVRQYEDEGYSLLPNATETFCRLTEHCCKIAEEFCGIIHTYINRLNFTATITLCCDYIQFDNADLREILAHLDGITIRMGVDPNDIRIDLAVPFFAPACPPIERAMQAICRQTAQKKA